MNLGPRLVISATRRVSIELLHGLDFSHRRSEGEANCQYYSQSGDAAVNWEDGREISAHSADQL